MPTITIVKIVGAAPKSSPEVKIVALASMTSRQDVGHIQNRPENGQGAVGDTRH